MFRAFATTLAGVPTGRNIAAAGEDIDTATVIESDIATVTEGTGGVKLGSVDGGTGCMVVNKSGASVNVYPADMLGRINVEPLGGPFKVDDKTAVFFFSYAADSVVTFGQAIPIPDPPTQEEIDAAVAAAEARAEARQAAAAEPPAEEPAPAEEPEPEPA